jgi:hypothetical protein
MGPCIHPPKSAGIRNTFILAGVSGAYFWRAKSEERHLGMDPAYREYADWMAPPRPDPAAAAHPLPPFRRPQPDAVPAQ